MNLFAADAGTGEKSAETPSIPALRLNEKFLPLEMAGMVKRLGGALVRQGVRFQTQSFRLQSPMKAGTDLVGFAVELRMTHRDFWNLSLQAEVLSYFADSTDKW